MKESTSQTDATRHASNKQAHSSRRGGSESGSGPQSLEIRCKEHIHMQANRPSMDTRPPCIAPMANIRSRDKSSATWGRWCFTRGDRSHYENAICPTLPTMAGPINQSWVGISPALAGGMRPHTNLKGAMMRSEGLPRGKRQTALRIWKLGCTTVGRTDGRSDGAGAGKRGQTFQGERAHPNALQCTRP